MNPLIQQIRSRLLKQNKNWLAVVCGETGSGKSYSAIKIAAAIDDSFSIEKIVFNADDLIKLLQGNYPPGTAIVFDEAGVGLPAREWYSIQNKILGYVLQTFRYKNYAVIFTVPSIDFIDIQARKLFHAYIETCGISRKNKTVTLKYKIPKYNNQKNKWLWYYPRISGKVLKRIIVSKPDWRILKEYETKKRLAAETIVNKAKVEIETIKPAEGTPITCTHCNTTWRTTSTARRVQCSHCTSWVKLKKVGIPVLNKC